MTMNSFDTRELVTFQIGQNELCIDVMVVREIRGWTPAAPLPHAPSYVYGAINLRGVVIAIIDLGARLGFAPTQPTKRHVIIVVQVDGQLAGLLVDAVTGILATQPNSIQQVPNVASDIAQTFVDGVLAIDDRMINLIGLDHVLPRGLPAAA